MAMNIKRGVNFSVIAFLMIVTPANFVRADEQGKRSQNAAGYSVGGGKSSPGRAGVAG